jgi:hypothetical protein
MTFLLSCLFYSIIGCVIGFFVHIFNGLIQTKIKFDSEYIKMTILNFAKTVLIMSLTTLCFAFIILIIPNSFYSLISLDESFLHQLVFYLFAFASFDFGLQN